MQLSGLLARGVRLIDQFVQEEPTPPKMMAFEGELSGLLREVGRRIMAWALNLLRLISRAMDLYWTYGEKIPVCFSVFKMDLYRT
jgi:hypothetical protein